MTSYSAQLAKTNVEILSEAPKLLPKRYLPNKLLSGLNFCDCDVVATNLFRQKDRFVKYNFDIFYIQLSWSPAFRRITDATSFIRQPVMER